MSLVAAATGLAWPSPAAAEVTLLVRDDVSVALDAPTGADEALRVGTGTSVRQLDTSLEDLALAAGCPGEPGAPACVASLAAAGGAQWVAIERSSRTASGWHVLLELRRAADGVRARRVEASCATRSECIAGLVLALRSTDAAPLEPTPPALDRPSVDERPTSSEPVAPPRVTARASRAGHAEPQLSHGPSTSLIALGLFVGAVVASVGAMIAGGVGVQEGHDASALGAMARPETADRVASLESSRDLALGLGTALAITSACLAIASMVVVVVERPRSEEGLALRLGGGLAPGAAMVAVDGRF